MTGELNLHGQHVANLEWIGPAEADREARAANIDHNSWNSLTAPMPDDHFGIDPVTLRLSSFYFCCHRLSP